MLHPFEAAKAAGREPYKVADLVARRVRAQGNAPGRAGNARADVDPQGAREGEAARGHPDHGQPAHDHSDGGPHRDADRARRRRALGVVQHLLDPGSRRRGRRRRPAGKRRHGAEPEGHAGVRVEGRDARRVLVVHERSARVARRLGPDLDRRRWRRRDAGAAQGRRVREGRAGAGVQARERSRRVGRHPRADPRLDGEGQDAAGRGWPRR